MSMDNPKYVYADWLIDGTGGAIKKKVLITIEKGIFTDIDSYDNYNAPDPALVTDFSQCTILPPFVDSHVHLGMSGTVNKIAREMQLAAEYIDIEPLISQHIHYHFTHGVLAVRDGGDSKGHVLRYQKEHSVTDHEPVILKIPGRGWHRKGRYGSMIGRFPADNESLPEAFVKDTDSADFVKIINSGPNSLSIFAKETSPQFTLEEIRETVCLAEKAGKKVMVHANGRIPVKMALEAGCHSIEHGFFMGRENIELMAEKKVFWVPTACAMMACAENIDDDGIHTYRGVAARNLDHQLELISLARECGVSIALGTDSGSIGVLHGEAFVGELKLLIKAGYSLPEAIRCAAYNGAQLLGIENDMGVIAKGRPANFIVARGMPAQLPRKLSYLQAIYVDGIPCKKQFFEKV